MLKFINFKKLTAVSIMGILITGTFQVSPSASVDSDGDTTSTATGTLNPNSYADEIEVDNRITLERTVTVEIPDLVTTTTTEKPRKLDVLFLADNTGSMGSAISNVQENARSLLQTLSSNYNNIQIGVARYYGDPSEYGSPGASVTVSIPTGKKIKYTYSLTYTGKKKTCKSWTGYKYKCYEYDVVYDKGGKVSTWTSYYSSSTSKYYGDSYTSSWESPEYKQVTRTPATIAYELQESVNAGSIEDAIRAINNWSASGGGDWPEANFFALHQAATSGAATTEGYATNYATNWRSDAKKIIVWFGDAKSHTDTIDKTEAIQALIDQDISVVAIHASSSNHSLTNGLDADSQASSIASETSGEFASVYSSELATTIGNLIGTVAVKTTTTTPGLIDLTFTSVGDTEGLDITYTCSDDLGCNEVTTGQSRKFKMDITGNIAGIYNFDTVVENLTGAIASNNITVNAPEPVYAD